VIGELPFTDSVNTVSATRAVDGPSPSDASGICGSGGATVWYRFTPSADIWVVADMFGTDYPPVIAFLTGSRGALTSLGCAFRSGGFNLTGDVTYFFMIMSGDPFFPSNAGGNLSLRLTGESLAGVPPRQAA
jgi:hypothetical protein